MNILSTASLGSSFTGSYIKKTVINIGGKKIRRWARKKDRPIKLQRLQKLQIWAFGLLVHQLNSL